MGADIGHMPQDTLMTVQDLDEDAGSTQKAYMTPGDFCIVAGKDKLPIVLGVLMGIVQANGAEQGLLFGCSCCVFCVFRFSLLPSIATDLIDLRFAWYHPLDSPEQNFRAGRKKKILDIFSPWVPSDTLPLTSSETLPSVMQPH